MKELTEKELRLRGYSSRTCKAYLHQIERFIRHFGQDPRKLSQEHIKQYLLHFIQEKGASRASHNQAVSALKFLCSEVLKRPSVSIEVHRPRKERKLPPVLSEEGVLKILDGIRNLKHRALLMLIYPSGLRVSEAIRLRKEDINRERHMLHVRGGKGQKDRYTILSDVALRALREYWKTYKSTGKWLFPEKSDEHLTACSVEKVFEQAIERDGIKKKVTVHTLRHSFATHLLEGGTDLRYIQELLGHRRPEMTQIYTHVMRKDIARIRSPLDKLWKEKG